MSAPIATLATTSANVADHPWGRLMASPHRADWKLGPGPTYSWDQIHTALLMDIRAQLTELKGIFNCPNALDIPRQLRAINRNTRRRKPRRGHK